MQKDQNKGPRKRGSKTHARKAKWQDRNKGGREAVQREATWWVCWRDDETEIRRLKWWWEVSALLKHLYRQVQENNSMPKTNTHQGTQTSEYVWREKAALHFLVSLFITTFISGQITSTDFHRSISTVPPQFQLISWREIEADKCERIISVPTSSSSFWKHENWQLWGSKFLCLSPFPHCVTSYWSQRHRWESWKPWWRSAVAIVSKIQAQLNSKVRVLHVVAKEQIHRKAEGKVRTWTVPSKGQQLALQSLIQRDSLGSLSYALPCQPQLYSS